MKKRLLCLGLSALVIISIYYGVTEYQSKKKREQAKQTTSRSTAEQSWRREYDIYGLLNK